MIQIMGCNMDDEQVRLEVNVKRLLEKCELIAKEDAHKGWRLEKVCSCSSIYKF